MAVALTKVLKKGFQEIVFCCLFKGQQSTDNGQRTTDFGHAVPELVEGITLGTSTGSVTEQLSIFSFQISIKKRRIINTSLTGWLLTFSIL